MEKTLSQGWPETPPIPEVSVYVQKDVGGLPYVGAELCDAAGEEKELHNIDHASRY